MSDEEFVVTFDSRPVAGINALDGLRRMSLADAHDVLAVAARIPKCGRIISVETLVDASETP